MTRVRWTVAAMAVGGAILVAAGCGGSNESSSATTQAATTAAAAGTTTVETAGTLNGTVGPGFTITLTQDGAPVESLPAGTYEIVVDDKADVHNFHLTGPNVDQMTEVGETGTVTWVVTLDAGKYTFQCDPHASSMNGSFTVT